MPSEIMARYQSGQNLYAVLFDTVGQIFETTTLEFETPAAANWGDYDLTLAEASTTGFYRANMPAVPEGFYTAYIYLRTGGSPATSDILVGVQEIPWGGSTVVVFNQTEKSGVASLLGRLGAFTGSGLNTVLGFLQALARKDVSVPSDLGGTYHPPTDSLEGSVDSGSSGATPEQLWTYSGARTLTQSGVQVASAVMGEAITVLRGDKLVINLTDTGSLLGRTKLWFTVKSDPDRDSDNDAVLQLTEADGLLRLNGHSHSTQTDGTLTVTDGADGDLTITLKGAAARHLPVRTGMSYDVQIMVDGEPLTRVRGTFNVSADVTQAVA